MMRVFSEKRGSALMQVLVLGGVMASVVVLLLRFSVNRTVNVVKTTRMISAKAYAESCMAKYTALAALHEMHGLTPPATDTCTIKIGDEEKINSMIFGHVDMSALCYMEGGTCKPIPNTIMKVAIDVEKTDELE